jgi:hypothetical protein
MILSLKGTVSQELHESKTHGCGTKKLEGGGLIFFVHPLQGYDCDKDNSKYVKTAARETELLKGTPAEKDKPPGKHKCASCNCYTHTTVKTAIAPA